MKIFKLNNSLIIYFYRKCDKTFAKKYNWKVHLRTHSNDLSKKFECTVCMKAFTQQSALNRHKRRYSKKLF